MGAVHGVYLKYVGLSALSFAGYSFVLHSTNEAELALIGKGFLQLVKGGMKRELSGMSAKSLMTIGAAAILKYSAYLNGAVAVLFKAEWGMGMLGKNPMTGQIPWWSYVLYFPFHLPSILYTYIHAAKDSNKKVKVPPASEVQPGWWVGGCYSNLLDKDWGGVLDLTVEFPERCIDRTQEYLLVATWDGVPPSPEKLDHAAQFAVDARKKGDVLIHCAHGRGRSTTLMCAALVKAGLFPTWEEAFEKGIKPGRSVCKLNRRMRDTLTEWQEKFVFQKKDD